MQAQVRIHRALWLKEKVTNCLSPTWMKLFLLWGQPQGWTTLEYLGRLLILGGWADCVRFSPIRAYFWKYKILFGYNFSRDRRREIVLEPKRSFKQYASAEETFIGNQELARRRTQRNGVPGIRYVWFRDAVEKMKRLLASMLTINKFFRLFLLFCQIVCRISYGSSIAHEILIPAVVDGLL